jgi:catechol 2,3-dioxygenase-like lactoylglutathione lyase family enzyme
MIISGIQQMGIGNPNTPETWKWYRKAFGVDVPVFDEKAEAGLMLKYTGNKPRNRHAVLALNMQGGGGFEIWQYTDRVPVKADFDIKLGDLGINITKIKSKNISEAYEYFKENDLNLISGLVKNPNGSKHFFTKDPHGNIFQVEEGLDWFSERDHVCGGVFGAIIGVTNIDNSRKLYSDILGYDEVVYDEVGTFDDLKVLDGGENEFRRVLLRHSKKREGAFSQLLGVTQIELVEVKNREPKNIFEGRMWGDQGFIHLCFDIYGMDELKSLCESVGYPFTVDSGQSFDMENAAGRFTYIEDNDGTLIEFVETHKVPILKKFGINLDLTKRNHAKSLPKIMIKALGLTRVKD